MNLPLNQIMCGDCIEVLKTLPENSIDAVVTDPPYGLGFMGKEWDTFDKSQFGKAGSEGENDLKIKKNFNILPRYNTDGLYQFTKDWASECFRVLKPGGYLLSFAGTRTQHKIASGIEDAGFEIRDMIAWVYGSGFPKSLNIGKAVDKLQGNEREVIGTRISAFGDTENSETNDGRNLWAKPATKEVKLDKGTSKWEGWGTALKPAVEPISVARKPLSEKSVAENVLKWGTGGINIDGCRVGTEVLKNEFAGNTNGYTQGDNRTEKGSGFWKQKKEGFTEVTGRFPANLIHDGSDEVVDLFPNTKPSKSSKMKAGLVEAIASQNLSPRAEFFESVRGHNDNGGSASRFFYCAKASKSERNMGCEGMENHNPCYESHRPNYQNTKGIETPYAGTGRSGNNLKNNHPTVKPISLMEYLIKLVSKKDAIVLDPFLGSGTTAIACQNLGRNYIGIEREEDYAKIAQARLGGAEIVKLETGTSIEILTEQPIEQLKVKKPDRCECGGRIVKIVGGLCCEDCMTKY